MTAIVQCGNTSAGTASSGNSSGATGSSSGAATSSGGSNTSSSGAGSSGAASSGAPGLTYASRRTDTSLLAQAQVDFLGAMAKNDGDRVNYAAVALETRENRELVELYRKALSIPFPIAMADAATLAGTGPFHDVSAVPVTVLIDREGRVAWRADGRVAKSEELRLAMRGLL